MSYVCPLLTKDSENPIMCLATCALRFQNMCSINVLAQTKYQEYKEAHKEIKTTPAE